MKKTGSLIDAGKEVCPEVNVEKIKCMVVSHYQNADQNPDLIKANRSFENVSQFRYLGTAVTNQNLIQRKLRDDWILAVLATIRTRSLCLLVCCQKM
jgi:hypothetical protein